MEKVGSSELTLDEKFNQLPIGGLIELPISKINPTDVDDGKTSMTEGPIEVYKDKSGKIYIYDGNHRFFQKEKDLYREYGKDFENQSIEVKKVKNDKPW